MQNLQKFYIDGQWVAPQSSKKMPVVNPATEEVIGEVILGNEEDVNIAVKAAKNAFMSFSKTSKEERMNILKNIRSIVLMMMNFRVAHSLQWLIMIIYLAILF